MRLNIFNFNHIAYLKAWSQLEGTPFSVNVEHDLPLANINSSSHGIEERPPRMSGGFSLSPISSTTKSTGMKWCPTYIFGDAQWIANGVITQLQAHTRKL
jgi:hypothetical protein